MGELLCGTVCAENQIPTKQIGFQAFLLKLVTVPGEPKPDLVATLVAGSPYAGGALNVAPRAKAREYVLESVNTLLLLHLESRGHFCHGPAVSRRVRVHLSL